MSFPFGGHIQFCQYLDWAAKEGCKVQSGIQTDQKGGVHTITRIISPDGKRWVIEAMDQREFMVPTSIARLDRRLGVKSPFFSLPDPDEASPQAGTC